jgi:hypothetical protein
MTEARVVFMATNSVSDPETSIHTPAQAADMIFGCDRFRDS